MDIIRERPPASSEHQSANRALQLVDEESMLQLGMTADACDIVVRFIRFLDKECFQPYPATSKLFGLQLMGCLTAAYVCSTLGTRKP